MKIALINNLYYPFARGGAEQVTADMAAALINAGHDVFIISSRPAFTKAPEQGTNGERIYRLWIPNLVSYGKLNRLPIFLRLIWHGIDRFNFMAGRRIKAVINKEKPNIVITHNLTGLGWPIARLIKKNGAKHIHYLHDIQLLHPSGLLMLGEEDVIDTVMAKICQSIGRFYFTKTDKVISPSRWLLNIHENRGFFQTAVKTVITNRLEDCSREERKESKVFTFLFAGQLEPHKGINLLLNAYKTLNETLKTGHRLMIVGSGSLENEVKLAALKNPKIVYSGKKTRFEVRDMMQGADLLIVPSLCYENSPAVVCEAQAAGLPVLASGHGGLSELLTDRDESFRPGNTAVLAAKMQESMSKKRWGKSGRIEIKKPAAGKSRRELIDFLEN